MKFLIFLVLSTNLKSKISAKPLRLSRKDKKLIAQTRKERISSAAAVAVHAAAAVTAVAAAVAAAVVVAAAVSSKV